LHYALLHEFDDIADRYISLGANENIKNKNNQTAWEFYNSNIKKQW